MPADKIETENGYKTYYSQDDSKLVTLAKINRILIIITLISSFLAIILAVAAAVAIPFIVQHFQSEDTEKILNFLQEIKNFEDKDTEKILNFLQEIKNFEHGIDRIYQNLKTIVQANNQEIERIHELVD